ncbi:MAG: 3-hydroxyisobutyrate dehydrogenase [Gammaproteobacteria bacterium]|nr:3-hydroxyisobutyrate dehydrogenase [Gammaproteobacteria bacterium]
MSTIGFIGLGHMGAPMALHLLSANYTLYVYDTNAQALEDLVAKGARTVHSLKEMASLCDVIFTSVQTGKQVSEICLSQGGLFPNAKSGVLYIDCSSIDILTTMQLHREAIKHQVSMLDAPVSGGVAGAVNATLTIMAGGDEKDFKRAEPFLQHLGKKVIHAGPGGRGQAAKICNNLLLGISMIGVSEAFTLASKLGLEPKKFYEISSHASGQCWAMTSYCPVPNILENVPSNHHYEPGFMAKMMLKDLQLSQYAAESVEAMTPLGSVATELYELYINQGNGEKDFSGIINLIDNKPTV